MDEHLLRIQERDERLEALHKELPELAKLDNAQRLLMARLAQEVLRGGHNVDEINADYQKLQADKEKLLKEHNIGLDVYQPRWHCSVCKDRGYVRPGELCQCQIKERASNIHVMSGFPPHYDEMTFETFDLSFYARPDDMAKKRDRLYRFVQLLQSGEPVGNLMLRGDVGRGKTHLALAIANQLLPSGKKVYYARTDALMEEIRSDLFDDTDKRRRPALDKALRADLFILDDLGREPVSEFVISQLTRIIETRNENNKSWIINTNLQPTEIDVRYGQRLADRIFEKCTIFKLESADSIRLSKKDKGVTMI